MILRRSYLTMTMLMVSLLFLCMSINHLKDSLSDYAVNQYTETAENYPSKINIYVPNRYSEENSDAAADGEEISVVPRNLVVCVGDEDEMSMKAVEEWVIYTKRSIAEYSSLDAYVSAGNGGELPEVIVLDPACVNWSKSSTLSFLDRCLGKGISVVFCGLPDVSVIEDSSRVRELLGIQSVLPEEASVEGFYLREGFLLGGAALYLEDGSDEALAGEEVFPGARTFPWYLPAAGTKIYMKGVPEGSNAAKEDDPIAIWRNSRGNAFVFAVNGDFMAGQAGIGLLSAMAAEMHAYELYPVVNAQNIILAGYPSLANENPEDMERLYSSSVRRVHQEVMWPGIAQLLRRYRYRATCMLAPQYDYLDRYLPDGEQLDDYLKLFAEQAAETGLYILSVSGTPLEEKLEMDGQFFQAAMGGYDIASFYAGGLEDEQILKALNTGVLASAKTVIRDDDGTAAGPVDFLSENVTSQVALDSMEYTYQSDFLVRSLETALGYCSLSFDLSKVAYPDDNETEWRDMSIAMASAVSICGQRYPDFARTTAAESDARIRRFLALDYSQSRTDDRIEVRVTGGTGSAWFILRTHNEAILEMEGGSWTELEAGAYLVEVAEENAVMTLGPADERYYR